jgi:hypothetical protein
LDKSCAWPTERPVQPAAAGRGPASRRCYPRRAGPIEMADQEPSRAAGLSRRRTNLTAETAHALAILILATEMCTGTVALTLCIRLRPLPAIRRELRLKLDAAGLLGTTVGIRWRLATLVLGPEVPAADEDNP